MAEANAEQISRILRQCLEEGRSVEIDGLGVFRLSPRGDYEFIARQQQRVFIAYVQEDIGAAEQLYEQFRSNDFDVWLDRKKLLPGQNWPRAIERAIEACDFFVACFSRRSVNKRGQFQSELRYALDCASRVPFDQVYFFPVRLDDCALPPRISEEIQYVDLFPDWDKGFRRILSAIEKQRHVLRKGRVRLPLAG